MATRVSVPIYEDMRIRWLAIAAPLSLVACGPGSGSVSGSALDIDDATGAEGKPEEREIDRAEDQTEMGIRIGDDGTITAGGTEAGETYEHYERSDELEAEELEAEENVLELEEQQQEPPPRLVLPPVSPAP